MYFLNANIFQFQLAGDIAKFNVAVSKAVMKHKKDIIGQQILLNRIADIAILLQSMGAVLSRANAAADKVTMTTPRAACRITLSGLTRH